MADHSSDNTTKKYSFVSTRAVILLLERHGWYVSSARETRSRKHAGFQQHVVRFRRAHDIGRILEVNEIVAELVLKTAHDGTTLLELGGGFQRCWCDNQCTVSEKTVATHKVKHLGYTEDKVLYAVDRITKDMPNIMKKRIAFKSVELNGNEIFLLGMKAIDLAFKPDKWEKYNKVESVKLLVKSVRRQDEEPNLWNVFNIIQEKLIKGGDFLLTRHNAEFYRTYPQKHVYGEWSRGIKSIQRDADINQKLWQLAEDAELTAGIY